MLAGRATGDNTQMTDWWPLAGLRVRTLQLELRLTDDRDLDALATLAAAGVHDPDVQPFTVPWTDTTPAERARSVLQYQWSRWAAWRPESWSCGVSGRLGYAADGIERTLSRGRPATLMRLRLDRTTWAAREHIPVTITGLEPCLPMFGLTVGDGAAGDGAAGETE